MPPPSTQLHNWQAISKRSPTWGHWTQPSKNSAIPSPPPLQQPLALSHNRSDCCKSWVRPRTRRAPTARRLPPAGQDNRKVRTRPIRSCARNQRKGKKLPKKLVPEKEEEEEDDNQENEEEDEAEKHQNFLEKAGTKKSRKQPKPMKKKKKKTKK